MSNLEHAFLFLRLIMYFIVAHELFLISTLVSTSESAHAKFMRWSCRSLSAVNIGIGFRATLTYMGRGTFQADVILTPVLILSTVILAVSVYHLLHVSGAQRVNGIRKTYGPHP